MAPVMAGWLGLHTEGGCPFVKTSAIPDSHAAVAEKCVCQHLMSGTVAIVAQVAVEQLLSRVIEVVASPFEHPLVK